MQINIGLVGIGTIGSGVVKILQKDSELIEKRTGIKLVLKKVCDLKHDNAEKLGIKKENFTKNFNELVNDNEIDVIVELIGGYEPAREFILKALNNKKHVVTANKAVIARHGFEFFKAAEKNNVNIAFEASVCGCIPILKTLQQSYVADKITSIYGILNGTTNYILTRMAEGMSYEEALKKAQELGFAEPNPEFDIEGKDAAQKLAILASIIFNNKIDDNIFTWGITKIKKIDLNYASEFGYTIKLLAIGKLENNEIELRVHPTMIPKEHELCDVKNELNAVYINGKNIEDVMLYGRGAGKLPTATVVVADIVDCAVRKNVLPLQYFNKLRIKSMDNVITRYYLRCRVLDKPGVLAKISKILGDNKISISGVWQKEVNKEIVSIVIITHSALEKSLKKAIKLINKLDVVKKETIVIRIEDLD